MAFYRDKNYENCIQKVKINLGKAFGSDKDEDIFVELKELPTLETMKLRDAYEEGEVQLMEYLRKVLPNVLIDHNFYETEAKKMKNEDVIGLLFEKLEATSKVVSEYSDALFTSHGKEKEEK